MNPILVNCLCVFFHHRVLSTPPVALFPEGHGALREDDSNTGNMLTEAIVMTVFNRENSKQLSFNLPDQIWVPGDVMLLITSDVSLSSICQ